jgi:hypothetical protein
MFCMSCHRTEGGAHPSKQSEVQAMKTIGLRIMESLVQGQLARRVRWGGCRNVRPVRGKARCVLTQSLAERDERDTSKTCSRCGHKQAMPLWKRTYRCPNTECRFVMDRDENSAVNILKRFFARLGPLMVRISMRCADVFTAIEDVNTFEHI